MRLLNSKRIVKPFAYRAADLDRPNRVELHTPSSDLNGPSIKSSLGVQAVGRDCEL